MVKLLLVSEIITLNNSNMNKVVDTNKKAFEKVTEVFINNKAIKSFVIDIVDKKLRTSELDLFKSDWSLEDALKITLIFNSMNFCYWAEKGSPKWSIEIDGETLDGSIALVRLLEKLSLSNTDFLNWNYLSKISYEEFKDFFKESNVEIPLIKERYINLVSLAKGITEKFDGNSGMLVHDLDAETFLKKLTSLDSFNDESIFVGHKVYFWKRAQLEVKMFGDIYESKSVKPIKNIEILTAFADYKVPQLLRHLNILCYSPELSEKVDSYQLIEKDSKYENEIRIATIVAVEYIKAVAQKQGMQLTSSQIDSVLWNRAASNKDNMKPYHRTYTTAY